MKNIAYIFSDLHGNLPALNAIISDIGYNEFDRSIKLFLGDYIDFGPFPNEVLDIIKILNNSHFVIGNHDQYLFKDINSLFETNIHRDQLIEHMTWTNTTVCDENRQWIKRLPIMKQICIDNVEILMCHGNLEDTEKAFLIASSTESDSEIIVTGHTHESYIKLYNGKAIINPGSVGESLDKDNRASYSILTFDEGEIDIVNKRVCYNMDVLENALIERKVPWRNEIIRGIREACI